MESSSIKHTICRTCLRKSLEICDKHSVFDKDINNMLVACTTIQIAVKENISSHICTDCVQKLNIAYNFKIQAEYSDKTLRNTTIKQENESNTASASYKMESGDEDFNNAATGLERADSSEDEDKSKLKPKISNKESSKENKSESEQSHSRIFPELSCDNKSAAPSDDESNSKVFNKYLLNEKRAMNLKFKCLECGRSYKTERSLTAHTRFHLREKRESMSNESDSDRKPTDCDTDSKSKIKSLLLGRKSHECEICQMSFISHKSLTRHIVTHSKEKPYLCNVCGKSFKTKTYLRKHALIHNKVNCDLCTKSFPSESSLEVHKLNHATNKCLCFICGFTCQYSSILQVHMRSHTGERPFKCTYPDCAKAFKKNSHLTSHIISHTGERRYECKICLKRFGKNSALNEHINTHTGSKPFACKICDFRCSHSGTLVKHMRMHKII